MHLFSSEFVYDQEDGGGLNERVDVVDVEVEASKPYCWPDNPVQCAQPVTTYFTWKSVTGFVHVEGACEGHASALKGTRTGAGFTLVSEDNSSEGTEDTK